jgi:hypothetical protein
MGLKKYLFPLFLTIFVFLLLQYVYPAVLSVQEKGIEKQIKQSELERTEIMAKSVKTLSSSLAANENAKKVYPYLPFASDHEVVMGKLFTVAVQDGVTLSELSYSEGNITDAATVQSPEASSELLNAGTGSVLAPPPIASPGMFEVSVNFRGSYESVRSFLGDASRIDRFNDVQEFSLNSEKTGVAPESIEDISGSLKLAFSYLPEKTYPDVYLLPIFGKGTLDVKSIDGFVGALSNIPSIGESSTSRRSNPFKQ